MINSVGNTINISAGMGLKLKIPVDPVMSQGKFAMKGTHPLTGDVTLINGFGTRYQDVGTVSEIDDEPKGTSVMYSHLKSERNTIWFFALTGEIGTVEIITVPIHDHSSIIQGGPAFGTYFSEYT